MIEPATALIFRNKTPGAKKMSKNVTGDEGGAQDYPQELA
jgi:hypothetical protein